MPLSARAQYIVENPESFLGLLSHLSYFEPHALYIDRLRSYKIEEEALRWEERYKNLCSGVTPQERLVVIEALRSHLSQKFKTEPR